MNQFRNTFSSEYETEKRRFRYAFVLKPSFNFSPLKPYCEKIVYATEGYAESPEVIRAELEASFSEFDENKDVLIPAGQTLTGFLAGLMLQRLIMERGERRPSIAVGIFAEGDYNFWRLYLDGVTEDYEIIQ